MHGPDRRSFLTWLTTLPLWRGLASGGRQQPVLEVRPSALFQQPDGRKNLVRITASGLGGAPAARARVTDRHGTLVGPGGLLPLGEGGGLGGALRAQACEPALFQVE